MNDLHGTVIGRWKIVSLHHKPAGSRTIAYWLCVCECGKKRLVSSSSLRAGRSRSCGCLQREVSAARQHKHGCASRGERSAEYRSWYGAVTRCTNPNQENFVRYGGRGIYVDPSWMDFSTFLRDMGRKPTPSHTLERLDNDGPYAPGNCVWATREIQNRNTRRNHVISFGGKSLCLAAWAEHVGIKATTISRRIKLGWPVDAALTVPLRVTRGNCL